MLSKTYVQNAHMGCRHVSPTLQARNMTAAHGDAITEGSTNSTRSKACVRPSHCMKLETGEDLTRRKTACSVSSKRQLCRMVAGQAAALRTPFVL